MVEAGGAAPALGRAVRTGAVFWVTAAAAPALPQALRSGGSGPRYLVAPADLATAQAGSPVFEVAGCVGMRRSARSRRLAARAA